MMAMSDLTDEEQALNVIAVRGPYLCAVSVIHSDWFQTSEEPFELTEDGFPVDTNVAEALIKNGKVAKVGKGHPADDPGTRITAYRLA
jgi:hypothetical protein